MMPDADTLPEHRNHSSAADTHNNNDAAGSVDRTASSVSSYHLHNNNDAQPSVSKPSLHATELSSEPVLPPISSSTSASTNSNDNSSHLGLGSGPLSVTGNGSPVGARSGVFRPCARCRSKKMKCDRVRPLCSSCQKATGSDVLCVYDNDDPGFDDDSSEAMPAETSTAMVDKAEKDGCHNGNSSNTGSSDRTDPSVRKNPQLSLNSSPSSPQDSTLLLPSSEVTAPSLKNSKSTKAAKTAKTGSSTAIRPSPLRTSITTSRRTDSRGSPISPPSSSPSSPSSPSSSSSMQLGTKWNAGFPNGSGAGEQEEYQERSDDEERSYLNDRDDVVSELSVKDDLDRDESPAPVQSTSLHPTKKQGNAAVSRMRKPLPAWLSETPTSPVTASSKAAAEPARKKRKTAAATKDSKTTAAATAAAGGSINNSPHQSSNNGNNNQGGIGSGQGKIVAEVASKAANAATNASMAAAAAAALAAATAATPPVPFVIDKNQKVRKWAKSGNIFQTLGGEVSMPLWTSDQDMLLNEPRPLLVQQALLFLTDGRTYSELARMAVLRDLDVIDLEYQDSLGRGSTPGSFEGSPGPTSTALATTATTVGSTGKRKRGYKKLLIPGNDAVAADLSTLEKSESRAGSNDGSKKWLTKRKRVKADNGDSAMSAIHSDRDGTPVPAASSPSLSSATVATKSNGRPVSTPSQRPRKYPCLFEGCGKSFMDKFHLDRHEARHVTEEIVCGIDGCTKAYPSISTVRRHQSIVHKDRKEELDLQRQKQTQVQREQKLQRYKEQQQQKGRMLMGQAQDSDIESMQGDNDDGNSKERGKGGSMKSKKLVTRVDRVAEADISESSSTRNSSPRSMDDDEDPDQDQDQEEEEEEEEEEEIEREEAVLVD